MTATVQLCVKTGAALLAAVCFAGAAGAESNPASTGGRPQAAASAAPSQAQDTPLVTAARAALDLSGDWEDSYGFTYKLSQTGSAFTGSVNVVNCGAWSVSGSVTSGSAFKFRATNPAPGGDCAEWFEYTMTTSSDTQASGSWINSSSLSGTVSMTLNLPSVVDFQQVGPGVARANGTLHFKYSWKSSTGNLSDLKNCEVGERVVYPGRGSPYVWPSPPWNGTGTANPTILWVSADQGKAVDDHSTRPFLQPYNGAKFDAVQAYRFRCKAGKASEIAGWTGIVIARRVYDRTGRGCFAYRIAKSGSTAGLARLPGVTAAQCKSTKRKSEAEVAGGTRPEIAVSVAQSEVSIGAHEPARATLVLRNNGDRASDIDLGRDGEANIELTVTSPSGATVTKRLPQGGFGASGMLDIAAGATVEQPILLNDWESFGETGVYAVSVRIAGLEGGDAAQLRVVVGPRDPAALARTLGDFADRAVNGGSSKERLTAARELAAIDDPLAVEALVRVVRKGGSSAQSALAGLARNSSPDAANALEAAQNNPDSEVRATARAYAAARKARGPAEPAD